MSDGGEEEEVRYQDAMLISEASYTSTGGIPVEITGEQARVVASTQIGYTQYSTERLLELRLCGYKSCTGNVEHIKGVKKTSVFFLPLYTLMSS